MATMLVRHLLCLVLVLIPLAAAAQDDYARLLAEGRAARAAGDYRAAERALSQALEIVPDSADALLLLGTVHAFQQDWSEAESLLARALELAPDYADVRVALARTHYWQQAFDVAAETLRPLLEDNAAGPKTLELGARIALARGRPGEAAALLQRAVEQAPENGGLWRLLGDAHAAAGNPAPARSAYETAARWGVEGPETLATPARRDRAERPWRLDLFSETSTLSGGRPDWHAVTGTLSRRVSESVTLAFGLGREDRGFAKDTSVEGALYWSAGGNLAADLRLQVTPDAAFRPDWQVRGGLALEVLPGTAGPIGPTWLLLDAEHASYPDKAVQTLKPGLRQHLLDGRLVLEARMINVWDEDGGHLSGWSARADVVLSPDVRLFGGAAIAPESELDTRGTASPADDRVTTVDTTSVFGGVRVDVTPAAGFTFSYAHHDRERSYMREVVGLGLTVRF